MELGRPRAVLTSMVGDNVGKAADDQHDEALIDDALRETFPASDPISPAVGPGRRQAKLQPDSVSRRDGERTITARA